MVRRMRIALAVLMIVAGILHFIYPRAYARTVPKALPAPLALVYVSGVAEILGGAGLLVPPVARAAAWGLVALFVAVFPANVNMAVNRIGFSPKSVPPAWALWARLPLQALLIWWAFRYT